MAKLGRKLASNAELVLFVGIPLVRFRRAKTEVKLYMLLNLRAEIFASA